MFDFGPTRVLNKKHKKTTKSLLDILFLESSKSRKWGLEQYFKRRMPGNPETLETLEHGISIYEKTWTGNL